MLLVLFFFLWITPFFEMTVLLSLSVQLLQASYWFPLSLFPGKNKTAEIPSRLDLVCPILFFLWTNLGCVCWPFWRGNIDLFNPQEWLATNFSLQYHPWIKHEGHKNRGNDHQLKKLLIVEHILLVSILGNV